MKIHNLKAKQIEDARGEPTLWVGVIDEQGKKGEARVPSGASRGKREALERRDANGQVLGNIRIIEEKIEPELKGVKATEQGVIDEILVGLDHTQNKSRLGANTILGVSLACARLGALNKGLKLYQYLSQLGGFSLDSPRRIRLFSNFIEGGKHVPDSNKLQWQEYLVIANQKRVSDSLSLIKQAYEELSVILKDEFRQKLIQGDENGYLWQESKKDEFLRFAQNLLKTRENRQILEEKPLQILQTLKNVKSGKLKLALDIAANSFEEPSEYFAILEKIIKDYNILSVEDPFKEADVESFAKLNRKIKRLLVIGDDLTVTKADLIEKAVRQKAIGGVIIKPNQIGTLSETIEAIKTAQKHNLKIIVSHRSGETKDSFIADLAWACGAYGLKSGAPCGEERLAKYERLVEIEEE